MRKKCKHKWDVGGCRKKKGVSYTETTCILCNKPLYVLPQTMKWPPLLEEEFNELVDFLHEKGYTI